MASGDWMKSYAWVCNAGHALAGYGVVTTAAIFAHARPLPVGIVAGCFGALVLFKEYFIDLRYESGEDVKSSTVDALGYGAGMVAGAGVAALAHVLGVV